ncbi:hypothetical protein PV08_11996 [Exophiala spinifera]|uniref:Uncharacterized protein n=1 Tax=Exophiala spinifera TaxID=91928 RepID=A0A0D2ATQ8_9EURO|nr:uncharacterized protein PV08_11996 [Exophiala spinifera]KIW09895.1 hypothetical protein PV08_11996 [Exophiala spinifera]
MLLFEGTSEEFVEYDQRDGLEELHVPRRRPDQVFGLARTPSLDLYARAEKLRGLRHSPFSNVELLYPFLICEAKSEGRGPGFESIETQTAFPIRTCLQLQDDLRQRSGVQLSPFVWFMAYQGDEWRVAGCLMHEGRYQIIDLWMGRTTSLDGALQLLLIIDSICEWARDVFRFEISSCLAGGKDNLRGISRRHGSPAVTYASRFSTQEPQYEGTTIISVHGDARPSSIPETDVDITDFAENASIASLTLEDSMMELDGITEDPSAACQDESVELYGDVVSHPLLKWVKISSTGVPWTAHATIRHSNMCLFAFSHLSLPEELDLLLACLRQASSWGVGSIRKIATSLVMSLTDHSFVRNTTMGSILQLRNDWLREDENTSVDSEYPLRALFVFRTYIRTSDWQIIRELLCISCTAQTAHNLAKIAGFSAESLRIRMQQSSNEHPLPISDFEALRGLTGSDAASAAISSKVLYHCLTPTREEAGGFSCSWESRLVSEDMKISFSMLAPSICFSLDRRTALMEVLKKPSPKNLRYHLGPDVAARKSAILLHKGNHWPRTTPSWCLMILDELELERSGELARRLSTQVSYHAFHFAPRSDEAGEPFSRTMDYSGDKEFLEFWAEDLRG